MLARWNNKDYEKKIKGDDIKDLEHGLEFETALWFSEFYQGRSALGVILRNNAGKHMPMDLSDFEKILKGINFENTDMFEIGLSFHVKVRVHRHGGYTRITPVL